MSNPRITVLMAVYNSEQYVREAIESILNQSFHDFEFLIIDDGSTDSSPSILAEYAARDPRIVLAPNEGNIGHANSLNKGLKMARGEYIARMDSDDISLPDRLLRQVAFMDAHPNIGICGTWLRFFGRINQNWCLPQDDTEIRCYMFFDSPLAHPTVMMRRRIIVDHDLAYKQEYDPAEDYALWSEAAKFTAFANLPEVLFLYRAHDSQLTSVRQTTMFAAAHRVRLNQLLQMDINVTDEIANFHPQIIKFGECITKNVVTKADAWIQELELANQQTKLFPEPAFSERLHLQWYYLCLSATKLGMFSWNSFWNSPLSRSVKLSFMQKLKFGLLCAFPWLRDVRRRFS
jgi:glycosyltransferase involved in cell wall biosynthesis